MRKILIFTTCFILLLTSFSFANNSTLNYLLSQYDYVIKYESSEGVEYYLASHHEMWVGYANGPWVIQSGQGTEAIDRYSLSGSLESSTKYGFRISYGSVSYANYDVINRYRNEVFFSAPPARGMVEMAVEGFLPSLMNPVGGTVSVALVMFGMLLAAMLLPRLIRRLVS